jgi:HK97 family phage major capsid protein
MTKEERLRINKSIIADSAKLQLLADKPHLTPQERRQYETLMVRISSLKSGFGLEETLRAELNAHERAEGFEVTHFERSRLTEEQRSHAQAWSNYAKTGKFETRDGQLGSVALSYMQGTGGGFVPVEFLTDVFAAMKWIDPLYDENVVTYRETKHGRPMQVGFYGDIENVAVPIAEGSGGSQTDIAKTGAAIVGAYSFKSPMYKVSMEAFDDVESAHGVLELFKKFAADRIARGVGQMLVNGNGTAQTLGLVPSLIAAGVTPTVAAGSSANTGGIETGANSIGSADLGKLYYSVDESYRASEKCAWLMQDSTLAYLAAITTKQGLPLVNWSAGLGYILGKRVYTSPSMDPIGVSKNSIVFGDLSYWLTRCSIDPITRVQLFKEAVGLAENGEVGLRMFARYDGVLLWNDVGSPAPMAVLQQHS